jgi:hypothetical protein
LRDTLEEEVGHVGLQSVKGGGIDRVDPVEVLLRDDSDHRGGGNLRQMRGDRERGGGGGGKETHKDTLQSFQVVSDAELTADH